MSLALLVISLAELIHSIIKYFNDDYFVYPVDFYTPSIKILTFVSLIKLETLELSNYVYLLIRFMQLF
jgi:hypothetical protein